MPMDWGLARDYAARDVHAEETPVTEAQWLASAVSQKSLNYLVGRTSDRKYRLFACACCRAIWSLLRDDRSRNAIEVVERFVDGTASDAEVDEARGRLRFAAATGQSDAEVSASTAAQALFVDYPAQDGQPCVLATRVAYAAAGAAWRAGGEPPPLYDWHRNMPMLLDVFGNPFRPGRVDPSVLAWNAGTLQRLAWGAYEERRLPEGTFDPARLVLLADALEDAGCTDTELLGHLRSPGPHVRGCWAVDLVLGKE
jgi:hypothetical protein